MQNANKTIAALVTCHNRKDLTLDCIDRLLSQQNIGDVKIEVFLVDDGSDDGTTAAVTDRFPTVHILHGDGSLYWTGGMRMAFEAASNGCFDYFLWLNDDTKLYPDSVARLLATCTQIEGDCGAPPIVVGSLRDPNTGELTYGGSVRSSRWHPLRFSHATPTLKPQECDVFNGNCVLLPGEVTKLLGNLHPKLVHSGGDYEYALRAGKKGVSKWIAPNYFGECPTNSISRTWMDPSMPLWQRYRELFSVKGQPPVPRLIYYFYYGGPLWIGLYPLIYLRPLVTSLKLIFSRR